MYEAKEEVPAERLDELKVRFSLLDSLFWVGASAANVLTLLKTREGSASVAMGTSVAKVRSAGFNSEFKHVGGRFDGQAYSDKQVKYDSSSSCFKVDKKTGKIITR